MTSSTPPGPPPAGPAPEYLESGGGGPLTPGPPRPGRRRLVVIGIGGGLALGVAAAAAWAATWYFADGPQAAEALPADTIAYAGLTLDPSGEQKLDALRTLDKFPTVSDAFDLDGDLRDIDIKERIFEFVLTDAACEGLDYADDIEPWLGDRVALALVADVDDQPQPVAAIEVTDEAAAEDGLSAFRECAGGEDDFGGWVIDDGWAVLADSEDFATEVARATRDGSLADDEDFRSWTERAGDPGIVTLYAAPAAGAYLGRALEDIGQQGFGMPMGQVSAYDDAPSSVDWAIGSAFADFQGMAAVVRFDDGALEVEIAGGPNGAGRVTGESAAGSALVESLPSDTAAAFGTGWEPGWFDAVTGAIGGDEFFDPMAMLEEFAATYGLDLPDDAETLLGEATAVAVGPDFDPDRFLSEGDTAGLPLGIKVEGDTAGIEEVLGKLRAGLLPEEQALLESDSEGDVVAVGPDADYRAALLEDGDLGGSETYRDVVREDDASSVLFVDLNAFEALFSSDVFGEDDDVLRDVEPLAGLGLITWTDDDVSHTVLRITTD
ncbi:MAG: DUF3352 domain-containing protein [Actinobacteria bacterium]|uniref:Unannotated protein n=1 Tax=freshwater metagenome TaxID=449393 RepID=A0A6J6NRV9_9ZZZZ|nr:DUF3352 domain-containing protein [Actinomycetota bacterium]